MNIGEKILLYKDRLGFKNYSEFARAADVSGTWLNDLSKREEIKQVNDMGNVIKLCRYLNINIEQLVINDDEKRANDAVFVNAVNIDDNCDDIGLVINEIVTLLDNKDVKIKMDGMLLNDKAKQICKDALMVVRVLTKQHL